jgi:hypothetical protein
MTTPGKFLPKPAVTTYDDGYVTELRPDGRQFIWYPPLQRYTVTLTVPSCCPTCGRALEPTATVCEAMAI